MSKTYVFECHDDDEDTHTSVSFTTNNECWSGFDGPMWKFLDFLKGAGFVFSNEAKIGVMNNNFGSFESATAHDEQKYCAHFLGENNNE